jgi:hypothetical protein
MTLLRRTIQWVVVPVVVVGLIAALYFQGRIDEEVRLKIERRFAEHYKDLQVRVHDARLMPGEGIEIRGLSISLPGAKDEQGELLYIDEMVIGCNTELDQLIRYEPRITRITIRRPIIRAQPDAQGKWNVAKLLPFPSFGGPPPRGEFEHATIEFSDPLHGIGRTFVVRDLNLKFEPKPSVANPGKHDFAVEGRLAADYTRSVSLRGQFAADGRSWQAQGKINELDQCPELCQALPPALAKKLLPLASLRAKVSAEYQVAFDASRKDPWRYAISGAVERGRIDDARLPYPLTDLAALFQCDSQGWSIHKLTARNGQTTLSLNMRRDGHQPGAPWSLSAESRQMALDERLSRALPPTMRGEWWKFLPDGKVNAKLKLRFDGKEYHPEATVECLGVSFYYHEFPYRLQDAVGEIEFKNQVLTAQLKAYSGSREVRIEGELTNPGPKSQGWLRVRADDLPLDEKLFTALKPAAKKIVKDLLPDGAIDLDLYFHRDQPNPAPLHKQLAITFKHCQVCYKHFPYPLQGIRGQLNINDRHWTFSNLEGVNDTGRVRCWGDYLPTTDGGELLTLNFDATNVPLEPELRDALRPAMQRIWSDLRPQGTVGLTAQVKYFTKSKLLDVVVHGNAAAADSSTPVSLEPVYFPYRLDGVEGAFDYRNGQVTLTKLRAKHGDTTLSADGVCDLSSNGSWRFELAPLIVDRMRLDRDLAQALPPRLAEGIAELNPVGMMALNGKLEFSGSGAPQEPLRTKWDMALDLHQVAAQCGVAIENLHGGVRLIGNTTPEGFQSRGELNLDNATYEGFQFTEIRGPIRIDEQGFALGRWAHQGEAAKQARRVTAKFYGGDLKADAWSQRGTPRPFEIYAELNNAELQRLTREKFPGRQNLSGKVEGVVRLKGAGSGLHNLAGSGRMHLSEADIYELPQMVQLLSLLSVKPPRQSAFSDSTVGFRLEGGRFYFDRLQFEGNALSLYGKGEMDLERRVKAKLYTMVGSHRIPGLSEIIGSASQQIMVINAEGPLDQLAISNEVLPGVNDILQQLQTEWQVPLTGASTTVAPPATGSAERTSNDSFRLWGLRR